MKRLLMALAVFAAPAYAQEGPLLTPYDGTFDDALFAIETAIVEQGLVIDLHSHTGDMLNRTGEDLGGEKIFDGADIFLFCSAVISRDVMEADFMNFQYCPYSIFVYDRNGEVVIGHRTYPEGPMQKVQTLLSDIVESAASF